MRVPDESENDRNASASIVNRSGSLYTEGKIERLLWKGSLPQIHFGNNAKLGPTENPSTQGPTRHRQRRGVVALAASDCDGDGFEDLVENFYDDANTGAYFNIATLISSRANAGGWITAAAAV